MDYSDKVLRHCLHHLTRRDVDDQAKRLVQQEQAAEQVEANRITRNRKRILEAMAKHLSDEDEQEALKWSPLLQARPHRERPAMSIALEELVKDKAIIKNCDSNDRTNTLIPGERFKSVCEQQGVPY